MTAIVVVLHVLVNRQAGLSCPTPWPDEAHFLWQAYAFCNDNSLFSSILNTERTIMWMPPAYLVLIGLFYKVVGPSLEAARFVSLIATCVFFLLLIRYLTYYGHRWIALGLSSLFFLNARFIACGNIARMEALLLMAVAGAFLLLQRDRYLLGMLVLALVPLLHFNGLYFGLAGLAFVLYRTSPGNPRFQLKARFIAFILIVGAAWAAYGVLVITNWDSFVHDMQYQLGRKGAWDIWSVVTSGQFPLLALMVFLCWAYAYRSRMLAIELLFLAVPMWLIWPIGHELWYEVTQHTGYLVISVFVVHVWFRLLPAAGFVRYQPVRPVAAILFIILLVAWNYRGERIEDMFHYPDEANMESMAVKPAIPYITADDRACVSKVLRSLTDGSDEISVEFQPHADAFFFLGLEDDGVQFVCPVFQDRERDVLVVHVSRNQPSWWKFGDRTLARAGLTRDSVDHIWYERDRTEQWFIAVVSETIRAGEFYRSQMARDSNAPQRLQAPSQPGN